MNVNMVWVFFDACTGKILAASSADGFMTFVGLPPALTGTALPPVGSNCDDMLFIFID